MTQPTTMIVNVAKAMCAADGFDPEDKRQLLPQLWTLYVEYATAALRTLLEPSEEMIEAGARAAYAGIFADEDENEDWFDDEHALTTKRLNKDWDEGRESLMAGSTSRGTYRAAVAAGWPQMILSALGEGDRA